MRGVRSHFFTAHHSPRGLRLSQQITHSCQARARGLRALQPTSCQQPLSMVQDGEGETTATFWRKPVCVCVCIPSPVFVISLEHAVRKQFYHLQDFSPLPFLGLYAVYAQEIIPCLRAVH